MLVEQPKDGLVGLAPVAKRKALGKVPNSPHQTFAGFMTASAYELAIVEFDDQGRCYNRKQMDGVTSRLTALTAAEKDVILLVFAHGWKHDARSDDPNLSAFRVLLAETSAHETATAGGCLPRAVLGVFIGWRGLSEFGLGDGGGVVADATFWGRQAAGQRVSTGSVRELFGRFRHYRNHRLNRSGSPLLVVAGHSFGGMVVFSALAQSLIEAASAPLGELVPTFADLVLLINPAIEGARYLAIQDLVCSGEFKRRTTTQLPVFVCAQAENDQPVGRWFPIGNVLHKLDQATIGKMERECVTHSLGFVPSFRTHTLRGPSRGDPFVLSPAPAEQLNPFWVVGAAPEVIDGHGGIWQPPFIQFLASLLFRHVQSTNGRCGKAEAAAFSPVVAGGPTNSSTNLAAFAKTIREVRLPTTA